MPLQLSELRLGKVDGKHEYLSHSMPDDHVFDAFLIPTGIDEKRLKNSEFNFIEGFRGTGKTSLIRWHAATRRRDGAITEFVLFKSDLTEAQRLEISKEVGITWADPDSKSMEISQDFKSAWTWFILHKLGEIISENPSAVRSTPKEVIDRVKKLLGLESEGLIAKVMGFMPKLEGANVRVRANIGFFETELGGDFKREGETGKVSLESLCRHISKLFGKFIFSNSIFLYFDELEVFFHSTEQHKRDQRMVRDLIFAVSRVNEIFVKANSDVNIIAAVRSEIIDSMGATGEEVDRLVHDKGVRISWHEAHRSLAHPLFEIIRRKIRASEKIAGVTVSVDPISHYFPKEIHGVKLDSYILDRSFYKPRDIVWRLSLAQKLFPTEREFSTKVFQETETEYSAKLWDEIRYELSATYSDSQIDGIESVLSGGPSAFFIQDVDERFANVRRHSKALDSLMKNRSSREILQDLFRLGAIGNTFRVGPRSEQRKARWAFRGDQNLLFDKKIVIHNALTKRLSTVAPRRGN